MFQSTTAHHHPSPKRSEILPSSFSTPSQPSATSPSSLQSSAANDANNDAAYRRGRPQQSYISSLINWLRIKNYQYEVTFSLYMLTPTEKAIFNLILFILISMLLAAASMYLPNHIVVMYRRIWYYVDGEITNMAKTSISDSTEAGRGDFPKDTIAMHTGMSTGMQDYGQMYTVSDGNVMSGGKGSVIEAVSTVVEGGREL